MAEETGKEKDQDTQHETFLENCYPKRLCVRNRDGESYLTVRVTEGVTAKMLVDETLEHMPQVKDTLECCFESGIFFMTLRSSLKH